MPSFKKIHPIVSSLCRLHWDDPNIIAGMMKEADQPLPQLSLPLIWTNMLGNLLSNAHYKTYRLKNSILLVCAVRWHWIFQPNIFQVCALVFQHSKVINKQVKFSARFDWISVRQSYYSIMLEWSKCHVCFLSLVIKLVNPYLVCLLFLKYICYWNEGSSNWCTLGDGCRVSTSPTR